LQPEAAANYGRLADVYEEMGRYDEALAVHEKEQKVSGARDLSPAVARIYARMGKRDEARRILELQRTRGSQWFVLATTYAALGDNDEAFRMLFQVTEERDSLNYVKTDPRLDSLHSDARWQTLLRRMNLATSD
jgi:tetratricopeptide (TPR) repeat protein